jgi:Tfp pilus assembly protein FimT
MVRPRRPRANVGAMRRHAVSRTGTSALEMAAALALAAILLGMAVPRIRYAAERSAVRGAAADIVTTLSTARQLAVANGGGVSVAIDAPAATLRVVRRGDTLTTRPLGRLFGVTLRTTRDSVAYDARGLGSGASNLTFVVVRGITADTVVVSRLGRVRW